MAVNGYKALTINTPASAAAHIYAEDEAQINRARFKSSGITPADSGLACTTVNNNRVSLAPGQYSMQGFLISVPSTSSCELDVESGVAGAYRHDLVIAQFTRGGGSVADKIEFKVLKGTAAASEDEAADPTLTQEDLTAGGSSRQEALFRIVIAGTVISDIERVAPYVEGLEKVAIGDSLYTLRVGTAGAEGYLTFVLEQ